MYLFADSEILALGFNEKFIRTWEYYFDYCGAGFKSLTLGNYQVHYAVTILKYSMSMICNMLVIVAIVTKKQVHIMCLCTM